MRIPPYEQYSMDREELRQLLPSLFPMLYDLDNPFWRAMRRSQADKVQSISSPKGSPSLPTNPSKSPSRDTDKA